MEHSSSVASYPSSIIEFCSLLKATINTNKTAFLFCKGKWCILLAHAKSLSLNHVKENTSYHHRLIHQLSNVAYFEYKSWYKSNVQITCKQPHVYFYDLAIP
ncbi:hypothetical protein PAHAL_5G292800 [Panicum hallii]|jgi:hypothetical protein|uniref:Uncharacterized protein n=1 Tax=Panicum hallii TaxID=206008 RepID=A0A2S3HV65_9POAL|nr:hypothetical protein PAHAL_5G292800 [Panicum hallii]